MGSCVQGQVALQVEAGRALAAGVAPLGLRLHPLRFGSAPSGFAVVQGTHIALHFTNYLPVITYIFISKLKIRL